MSSTSIEMAPLEFGHTAKPSPGPHENVVFMKPGHTVDKHFEYLKETLVCSAQDEDKYRAILTDDERERARSDPGVLKVYQSIRKVEENAQKNRRDVITYPDRAAPGFNVMFVDSYNCSNDYTMDQHFARIGFTFEFEEDPAMGYHAHDISFEQAEAVLHDPMVELVEQNWYGRCYYRTFFTDKSGTLKLLHTPTENAPLSDKLHGESSS